MKHCKICDKEFAKDKEHWIIRTRVTKAGNSSTSYECRVNSRAIKNNWKKKPGNYRRWENANPEKVREYKRNYTKEKRATDPTFKLIESLRTRLYQAVRGINKSGSAVKDLGCTAGELRTHLESQFTEGMNWENHGDWHIDHRIPLISFDLTNREELLKACNYINLQPLWCEENLSKGSKLIG